MLKREKEDLIEEQKMLLRRGVQDGSGEKLMLNNQANQNSAAVIIDKSFNST